MYDLLHRYIGVTLLENQLDRDAFPLRSEIHRTTPFVRKVPTKWGRKRAIKSLFMPDYQ